jgi:hypothetical protein
MREQEFSLLTTLGTSSLISRKKVMHLKFISPKIAAIDVNLDVPQTLARA